MRRTLLLSGLLFLAPFLVLAQIPRPRHVLYVDGVHGNDNNNCKSRKTACKTIGHAISLASADDAILVGPATYDENLTIDFNLGIIGTSASTTIIDGQGANTVVTIRNNTIVVLAGLTIRNGSAPYGAGGGVANYGGIVTIFDSIITQNVANNGDTGSDGGGIFNAGTLALDRSTVSQNQATGDYYCYGGGIYNDGVLTIADSTISGNTFSSFLCTDVYGAGIYNDGTMSMNNSTVARNNTGGGYFGGGGLYNDFSATATISNSTIFDNMSTGSQGGGIENMGPVKLQNSIIASNQTGNCLGEITSYGYNLSSDSTCNLNGPGDLNNTEPKLGPLKNNGGPTQTVGELSGSPTIDAGNPNGCTDGRGHLLKTDQRGAPRPDHEDSSGCDMGAFERQTD